MTFNDTMIELDQVFTKSQNQDVVFELRKIHTEI
jgi:hypothetical protein